MNKKIADNLNELVQLFQVKVYHRKVRPPGAQRKKRPFTKAFLFFLE